MRFDLFGRDSVGNLPVFLHFLARFAYVALILCLTDSPPPTIVRGKSSWVLHRPPLAPGPGFCLPSDLGIPPALRQHSKMIPFRHLSPSIRILKGLAMACRNSNSQGTAIAGSSCHRYRQSPPPFFPSPNGGRPPVAYGWPQTNANSTPNDAGLTFEIFNRSRQLECFRRARSEGAIQNL